MLHLVPGQINTEPFLKATKGAASESARRVACGQTGSPSTSPVVSSTHFSSCLPLGPFLPGRRRVVTSTFCKVPFSQVNSCFLQSSASPFGPPFLGALAFGSTPSEQYLGLLPSAHSAFAPLTFSPFN